MVFLYQCLAIGIILHRVECLLEIKNFDLFIGKGEERVQILHDISIQVGKGRIVGLIGPSGSGKSMIARSILGLNKFNSLETDGSIIFNDDGEKTDLQQSDLSRIRNSEIGIVFQHSAKVLNPSLKIGEQITEKLGLFSKTSQSDKEKITYDLLEEVGLAPSDKFFSAYPHQLSGGQLQRCLIALGLANDPKLIIADEPLSALDSTTAKGILELLSSLQKKRGMAIILISHDLKMIFDYCDRIVILNEGQIISQGDPNSLYAHTQPPMVKEMISAMVMDDIAEKTSPDNGNPIFSIQNISKSYEVSAQLLNFDRRKELQTEQVLDGFTIDIYENEILGIYGPSGCGKSTLARLMCRLESLDDGVILFRGKNISDYNHTEVKAFRKDCQIIFQDPLSAMSPHRTVRAHLEDVSYISGRVTNEDLTSILNEVDLPEHYLDKYPHEISGGERQRVLIARTLMTGAHFLICDEIFSSLDILVAYKIADLLKALVKKRGLTILFISHDRKMMERLASRVISM